MHKGLASLFILAISVILALAFNGVFGPLFVATAFVTVASVCYCFRAGSVRNGLRAMQEDAMEFVDWRADGIGLSHVPEVSNIRKPGRVYEQLNISGFITSMTIYPPFSSQSHPGEHRPAVSPVSEGPNDNRLRKRFSGHLLPPTAPRLSLCHSRAPDRIHAESCFAA